MKKSPCTTCTNRTAECHAECGIYAKWKDSRNAESEKIKAEKTRIKRVAWTKTRRERSRV